MDPRRIMDEAPMTWTSWRIVAIMVGLLALDGFDVLSISFASPGIAADWGVDRGSLGIVLSMELIGMTLGSLAFGSLTDRMGRRGTILTCLALMAGGMFAAATASSIVLLCCWRVLTGLGIGGMLAATNAATAEAANTRYRALCVALMAGGYPLGNIIGGSIAAVLLTHFDWRAIFVFGGLVSLAFIPLVFRFYEESVHSLMERRPAGALGGINRALARIGQGPLDALPEPVQRTTAQGLAGLFTPGVIAATVLLTLSYLAHIMTFYFLLKWTPKIVADLGFAASSAAGVLVWASVGGALGALTMGIGSLRLPVRSLTIAAMVGSIAAIVAFGQAGSSLGALSVAAAVGGFFTNAGVVGLYALMATSFPARLRGTGTGFVIGIGRGGSALAPIVAGALFQAGYALGTVAILMACGSVIGAIALIIFVARRQDDPQVSTF